MERISEISYHIVKQDKDLWVLRGFDSEGNEAGNELVFQDGQDALAAYIELNGFTDITPENILYYLGSA